MTTPPTVPQEGGSFIRTPEGVLQREGSAPPARKPKPQPEKEA